MEEINDNESFLKDVKLLVQMHSVGLLGGEVMPEDALIGIVPEDELSNVLTLGMSLNYQRNSYTLWQSVAQAYLDDSSRWIFNPHDVSESDLNELRNVLLHHRVALQPNRHPEIWQRVAKILAPIDVHTPLWLWSRAGFPSLSVSEVTPRYSKVRLGR